MYKKHAGRLCEKGVGNLWLLECFHLRSVVYSSCLEKEEKPFQFHSNEQQTLRWMNMPSMASFRQRCSSKNSDGEVQGGALLSA